MIKSEKGKVEIRGTYSEICADYFCIAKAIESSSEESKRFKATIILKAITENKIKKENLEKQQMLWKSFQMAIFQQKALSSCISMPASSRHWQG